MPEYGNNTSAPLLPVAILAGGLATRLRPVTEKIPKSLVDVGGEPFIQHQLRLLRRRGLLRIVICAGYLGEMIRDEVGDGARYGLKVSYSFDGPVLLGTAGALRTARSLLGDAFFVLYGDSYLDCDYAAIQQAFLQSGRKALMTVYRNDGRYDASNVVFHNGRIGAYDKRNRLPDMHWIDYGLGVLSAAALERVAAEQHADLADVYADLLVEKELAGYEVPERFYEVGSFAGLEELSQRLRKKRGVDEL